MNKKQIEKNLAIRGNLMEIILHLKKQNNIKDREYKKFINSEIRTFKKVYNNYYKDFWNSYKNKGEK